MESSVPKAVSSCFGPLCYTLRGRHSASEPTLISLINQIPIGLTARRAHLFPVAEGCQRQSRALLLIFNTEKAMFVSYNGTKAVDSATNSERPALSDIHS